MSNKGELVVHTAIDQVINCHVDHCAAPANLPTHVMDLAHELLRRLGGSTAACCTLADLITATYQLGMSRALASVAAGLEGAAMGQADGGGPTG